MDTTSKLPTTSKIKVRRSAGAETGMATDLPTKNGETLPISKSKSSTEAKDKKPLRFAITKIVPADIVDSWKLFEAAEKLHPQKYPNLEEETPFDIRAKILSAMCSPHFFGVMARVGKKPIGQMTGMISVRPYGSPRVYFSFWLYFVDPAYRSEGVAKQLFLELSRALKAKGVHSFESVIDPELIPMFEKVYGGPLPTVSHRIIGKLRAT